MKARKKRIQVVLNEEEFNKIKKDAEFNHLSMSSYLKILALRGKSDD